MDHSRSARKIELNVLRRVRTKTVLQMEAAECGAAALAIVFAYHRLFLPLERLREECGVSRDGTNAARLLTVARRYGFNTKGLLKEPDELTNLPLPAIIHWNFDHFVVLEKISRDKACINDPARGRRTVTRREFDHSFTGPILIITPSENYKPQGSPTRVIPVLFAWLSGFKRAVALLFAVGLCLVLPGIAVAALSRAFVDSILIEKIPGILWPLAIGVAISTLCSGILTWIQREALSRLAYNLVTEFSSNYLWHALRLPLSFHLARHPSDIAARVEIGDRLTWLLSGDLPSLVLSALMAVFYGFLMYWVEPVLFWLVFTLASIAIVIDRMSAAFRVDKASQVSNERARLINATVGGLQAIETLKANGLESNFLKKWTSQHVRSINAQHSLLFSNECFSTLSRYLHILGTQAVIGAGAWLVMRGEMSIGTLVAFQSLTMSFFAPLSECARFAGRIDEIGAQIARFRDVLDYPVENHTLPLDPNPATLVGRVEFQSVTFGYNPLRPPCVVDLNFTIEPGQRVAIVGRTGSGKSTIARLISGLIESNCGDILIDKKRRKEIPTSTLTSGIAIVEQEIHLFEGTIAENLTLWDTSILREQIERALSDACLSHVMNRLPLGIHTPLIEGGRNLSGGERQRLEVARALLREPKILILDEATSALDPEIEKIMYDRIRQRGCTCIVIAHRLSAIRDSDEILVVDSGRIVERGRHEDLWRANGIYRQLLQDE